MQDTVVLDRRTATSSLQKLCEELKSQKRVLDRLEALLPLFENGRARLADALEIVAPGKEVKPALAAFQVFCNRVNKTADLANIPLRLAVDQNKRDTPKARHCWLEGPDPSLANLAEFTTEAVSKLTRIHGLIYPDGRITRVSSSGVLAAKPLIRFFVSYASKDADKVEKLQALLETQLKVSKSYQFEVWSDRKIELGADWCEEIRSAIDECDFGLLFVSPEFLASSFIIDTELAALVDGNKPVIPIGLKPINFTRMDLHRLREKQFFRLKKPKAGLQFFSQCNGEAVLGFAHELADEIERRVTSYRESASKSLEASESDDFDEGGEDGREDALEQTSRLIHERMPLGKHLADPEALPTTLSSWDRDGKLNTENRTKAVDFLVDWACDPEQSPFAAVLGEVGIGKTTTLMMMAKELERRHLQDNTVPVPIFIDLREYCRDSEPTLESILDEVLRRHWQGDAGRSITPEMMIRAVQQQRAVIIFDGLDEKIIPLSEAKRVAFIHELWRVLPPEFLREGKSGQRGKMIISCRSHYFPNVVAQNSAFVGQGRDGVTSADYIACVILPFRKSQIRQYLASVLGSERVDAAMELVQSVHNLGELASRPMLLNLISEQIAELEHLRASGATVLGVTLYELLVEKWLRRDEGKHQFTPEHKLEMMESLAIEFWRENVRQWPWKKVGKWLDCFLLDHPEIRVRYENVSAEVMNQDFRTATFFLRPDTSKDGFQFAHTSLMEYFIAVRLVRALAEREVEIWDLRLPSAETLDFIGQMLATQSSEEKSARQSTLESILQDADAPADARRTAFLYWMLAIEKGWPEPVPGNVCLDDLDLEGQKIRGKSESRTLNLRGASLVGACLDHAALSDVDLAHANANRASFRLAEFHRVRAEGCDLEKCDLTGSIWRQCDLRGASAEMGNWHDADVIQTETSGMRLPDAWDDKAAVSNAAHIRGQHRLALRAGHGNYLSGCAFSPDGQRVLSASGDKTLKLWDASSGHCLLTLEGHGKDVSGCAFSPDGERVLSASWDKTLKLWDASSGRCLLTLEGHRTNVLGCAFSPNGQRVLSASGDNTLKLWDASSGRCLRTFSGHSHPVYGCAFSPDGQRVLSASRDKTLKLWDASRGPCVRTLEGHGSYVSGCAFSPDGQRVLSASGDQPLKLWDASSGRCLLTLEGHRSAVLGCAFSSDGQQLLSVSKDQTLKLWDASSGRCLRTLEGHGSYVSGCAFAPDGQRVLSASWDKTLKLWDASSGRCLLTLEGHGIIPRSCVFSPDGRRVLSASGNNTLKLWDALSGRCLRTLKGHGSDIRGCAFSPDGKRVLSASGDNTLKLWDVNGGHCLRTLQGHSRPLQACAFSPDGEWVLSASGDNTLKLWDASSGRCLRTLKGHSRTVHGCAFSPDGQRVVSGSKDKTLNLWDASSGRCLLTLEGHGSDVTCCEFSPDGQWVVSASMDKTLKLWDASSGRCLRTLAGHAIFLYGCAFSPDGQRLLSAGGDNTLKLWDANSGRCLRTLVGHGNYVLGCDFSPDGQRVVSCGLDGTVRIWDADSGACLFSIVTGADDESAVVDFENDRILHATPEGWRLLGWQTFDEAAGRLRLLPAEYFGPLPGWEAEISGT